MMSWRSPTTPMPMETQRGVVFERLFGQGDTDPGERRTRLRQNRSILDSVSREAAPFLSGLGASDRIKLNQYLDAVRDVEQRIQRAQSQCAKKLPVTWMEQTLGFPEQF